ncbi:class II fructose-bisphosphate aldolase [Paratissierella segnis]|jgi:ketose-bisphosphate aldolase|uniref:Class II fructose-bisphosphate aldolase n=1 Tax=Paratissierella segnis TaxID=2763679 RepID=A0A926IFV6_9FIRM|nr:class II fructose-bisphosphate aldolase [Paratissierella segnis]MBC8588912.1 class II fructose-bisphosphate aldolase [Paratissierella segnis]
MLVNSKEMLLDANSRDYAIPSPDFINLNMVRSYIEVAEKLDRPSIIAFSEGMQNFLSLEEAYLIGSYYAEKAKIPVALHIDHGKSIDFIKKAIDQGFTSVMIDASTDSFEENVRKTKEIVEYAHPRNVTVEAEIGHVGAGENYENEKVKSSKYTGVNELVKFVNLTNIDSVAVSIGTAHGFYNGTPKINFERLVELKSAVSIPLVLHGGSSTGDENLKKCAELGISKINIFTDLCVVGANSILEERPNDYRLMMMIADKAIKEKLEHYYRVFNCC